jgi:hypothetical protein
MAITQKFYPKFFMNAMLDNITPNVGGTVTSLVVPCTAKLFTEAQGAYEESHNVIGDVGTAISLTNPTPNVTVTFEAGPPIELKFSVGSMSWTPASPTTFRYVVIATTAASNYVLMHLDLGANITSGGTVTLTMTAGSEPALNFTT